MMILPSHAVYYRLALNRGDGVYEWGSATYTDVMPIIVYSRLKGIDEGYVFAATHPNKLQGFLDRWNEGKRSVCVSVSDLVRGVQFRVSHLEKDVEMEDIPKPPTPKETTAWVHRLEFIRYLVQEKGLFDEWYGETVPPTTTQEAPNVPS